MLFKGISRASSIAVASLMLMLLIFPMSSYSNNGNLYGTSCACTTTAQFQSAAATAAGHYQSAGNGTYVVVSTSAPMTAYMKVVMKLTQFDKQNFWIAQSETPISSTGSFLSGQTESQLESYFGSLDATLFGSRKNPEIINEPTEYQSSIINSNDAEIGPGIDQALADADVAWSTLPTGFVITVKFEDGTTAQFIKFSNSTDHWQWTGIAHNSAWKPINRNGTVIGNPNTAGAGAGDVHGNYNFGGTDPSFNIDISFSNYCLATITIGDDLIGIYPTAEITTC